MSETLASGLTARAIRRRVIRRGGPVPCRYCGDQIVRQDREDGRLGPWLDVNGLQSCDPAGRWHEPDEEVR